jgi:hypothetical protein
VQKLTKRKVMSDDIDDVTDNEIIKIPKTLANLIQIYDPFLNKNEDIIRISRLFEGKKFCVINGDAELDKNDITIILQTHMADVLQNAGSDTFCILVGNPETVSLQF